MRHWFRDRHFKSLLRNSGYLAASRAVAAVAALASLAFAGRSLGVAMLGMLILIHSYAKAAHGLSTFQSWQLIVRYGGQVLSGGQLDEFRTSTGFALALDLLSGIAGMAVAILLAPLIGGWFGIAPEYLLMAMLYCTLIPAMAAATPIGVLRALDRFDLISWQDVSSPIARALLCAIAWANGAGLAVFLAIWFVTELAGQLLLWFLAWRELRRRGLIDGVRPTLRPDSLPGAWRFAVHVNLTSSLVTAWGPVARLVIGGLVGPAGAAIYRIAASLADAGQRPADLLAKAYYPEVVRMDLATSKPWKLMLRGTALATAVGLVAVLVLVAGGRLLIDMLFGAEFLPAYPVLLILVVAPLIGMISFPLPPMLYALDRPDAPLKARLGGTIVYFIVVAPLCWRLGVTGAAIAFVLANVVMVALLMWQLRSEYRRVRSRQPSPSTSASSRQSPSP